MAYRNDRKKKRGRRHNILGILLYITISVLTSCVSCFFGKRLYFPILMLTVFTAVLTAAFSLFDITWKVGLAALAVGLVAALLSAAFYKLGVLALGGVLWAGFGQLLTALFPVNTKGFRWVIVLVSALALGLCALKWHQLFIMASTAYHGAMATVIPLGFLALRFQELPSFVYADGLLSTISNLSGYLKEEVAEQYMAPLFTATILLEIIGFLVQYRAEWRR